MVQGHARFGWIEKGVVVETISLAEAARRLGINPNEEHMAETPKDLVTLDRAAAITGFSPTVISRYVGLGKIKKHASPDGNPRRYQLSADEVMKWAEKHKANGAAFRPRRRKKGSGARPNAVEDRSARNTSRTAVRLTAYLEKLKGTPLEMTREEFMRRVVEKALDKLGA